MKKSKNILYSSIIVSLSILIVCLFGFTSKNIYLEANDNEIEGFSFGETLSLEEEEKEYNKYLKNLSFENNGHINLNNIICVENNKDEIEEIENNIAMLNEMVDNNYGYINQNGEFIFYDEDLVTFFDTAIGKDFKFCFWGFQGILNEKGMAIVGVLSIIIDAITTVTVNSLIKDLEKDYDCNKYIPYLKEAFKDPKLSRYFDKMSMIIDEETGEFITFLSNALKICSIALVAVSLFTGFAQKVFNFILTKVIGLFLPNKTESVLMLLGSVGWDRFWYSSCKMKVNLWGSSFEFLS